MVSLGFPVGEAPQDGSPTLGLASLASLVSWWSVASPGNNPVFPRWGVTDWRQLVCPFVGLRYLSLGQTSSCQVQLSFTSGCYLNGRSRQRRAGHFLRYSVNRLPFEPFCCFPIFPWLVYNIPAKSRLVNSGRNFTRCPGLCLYKGFGRAP